MFETRPNEARVPAVKKGTLIKVGCCGERFWCIVSEIERDGRVLAKVDNDLVWLTWQKCAREHASLDIFERCALIEHVLKCCLKRD